jgi:hypothetical protein
MSKLVFKLASVSTEEADGVRKALEDIGVEFYETPAGSWGWSLPGIWVKHNVDFFAARKAIDNFQETYVRKIRETTPPVIAQRRWKIGMALILSVVILFIFNYFWLSHWL